MPEYSHLINYNMPWLKPSKSSFIKVLITFIKPGIYLHKCDSYCNGFFVSKNKDSFNFTLFYTKDIISDFSLKESTHSIQKCSLSIIEFLIEFLEHYYFYDERVIKMYYLEELGYFFIHYFCNVILWVNGRFYFRHDFEYYIRHYNQEHYLIFVEENYVVSVIKRTLDWPFHEWTITERNIEPTSIESYFINEKAKDIYDKRSAVKLEFKINHDDYILVNRFASKLWISMPLINDFKSQESEKIYEMFKG